MEALSVGEEVGVAVRVAVSLEEVLGSEDTVALWDSCGDNEGGADTVAAELKEELKVPPSTPLMRHWRAHSRKEAGI